MNGADQRIQLNPRYRLQWEPAQNCHVLLYPEGLVKLSDTAHEILRRCQSPRTVGDLIDELQQAYPEADTLPEDVRDFLQEAQQQEWIKTLS
jgi:pyrroloquinoline quinone biosynthesis protein D